MRSNETITYELSNLPIPVGMGNVLTTVTDKKIPVDDGNNGTIDWYVADITSATDYYPFGSPMDGRTYSSDKYRFGFNGKENDDEVKGAGGQQDYGMRIYDSRLCKFLSADPLIVYGKMYPELSTYQFASNTPIEAIDKDGLEAQHITSPGDTYSSISKQYGVSVNELKKLNNYEDTKIPIGAAINLTKVNAKLTYSAFKSFYDKGAVFKSIDPSLMSEDEQYDFYSEKDYAWKLYFNRINSKLFPLPTESHLSFPEPKILPPGSPAMQGMWELTPEYIGFTISFDYIPVMGLGVDLNFGYMRGQGFRVFPEIRGGWGYSTGPSMSVSFGYKNHSLLKKPTYESIQGYGNYANLGFNGVTFGYSNSKLNPSPFSPNTWNIFSFGLASPGFSFGQSITFTRETFK